MNNDGIASLSLFKIDRIHSFDIRYSLFDIRYSLFRSFLFDQTGCPLAGLRRAQSNRGRALVSMRFPEDQSFFGPTREAFEHVINNQVKNGCGQKPFGRHKPIRCQQLAGPGQLQD